MNLFPQKQVHPSPNQNPYEEDNSENPLPPLEYRTLKIDNYVYKFKGFFIL